MTFTRHAVTLAIYFAVVALAIAIFLITHGHTSHLTAFAYHAIKPAYVYHG